MELNAGSMFVLAIVAVALAMSLWEYWRSPDISTLSPTAACEARGVAPEDMEFCLNSVFSRPHLRQIQLAHGTPSLIPRVAPRAGTAFTVDALTIRTISATMASGATPAAS